jgi:hypothetical protein
MPVQPHRSRVGGQNLRRKEVMTMTVYEALTLAITFATLVVSIIVTAQRKK